MDLVVFAICLDLWLHAVGAEPSIGYLFVALGCDLRLLANT